MKIIPYGKQCIDNLDIAEVIKVLKSDWITQGSKISEFEAALAKCCSVKHAVAVSSGTAALHAAMNAIGISPGDEVIVPPITFAASANCIVYQGGTPVFSDVESSTLLLDPKKVESKITQNTKAIIAVDYAGQPCDYGSLRRIASKHSLALVSDACHALGAKYKGQRSGSLADLTIFSFHPVKHITTGEGGMIVTDNMDYVDCMRIFRNHGITADTHQRKKQGSWVYEMVNLGYNYRITDFQSALGNSQLQKLPQFLQRRRAIARKYDKAFTLSSKITPLIVNANVFHAYHLYVVKIDFKVLGIDKASLFTSLQEKGVAVNVHYMPVYLHPFYRNKFNSKLGLCPIAEAVYEQIISLPIFPNMTDEDVNYVIENVLNLVK